MLLPLLLSPAFAESPEDYEQVLPSENGTLDIGLTVDPPAKVNEVSKLHIGWIKPGFNQFYYSFSPYVADYERENPVFKEAVKVTLTPMLTSLTLLNYVQVDTEEEMLGYGIGIILLNIGMYFVAPAAAIIAIKNRLRK